MAAKEKEVLFEEILEAWLEEIYQTHALSTYVKYTHHAKKYILPYVQSIPIKQITPGYMLQFFDDLKKTSELSAKKRGLTGSDSIIHTTVMIVNRTMKTALAKGIISEWSGISCGRKKKKTLVQVLSVQEQTKLEKYIKETWSQTGFGIYLCLFCYQFFCCNPVIYTCKSIL